MANQKELNQEDYNEFDYLNVEKLPTDVFNLLADELPKDWKKLAYYLGISSEEVERVLDEYNLTHKQIIEIINSWCRKNPDKTWKDIKSGLIFCGRNDVVVKGERKLTVRSIFGVQPSSEMSYLRKKELNKIHSYLMNLQVAKNSTLVLYGMSGVGKTQLVKRYCEDYHSCYKNLVWIDAAFVKLQTSMIKIGEKLGLSVQDSKGDYIDIEIIVEKIHNYYKSEKTLYIFDNVDNESVRNLEMYISKKPNSYTLITSQWRIWTTKVNKMLVDVFSFEEAFDYVKNNIKENTDENLSSLVKELSYHPFAITQAIKYINIHKISIEKYLHRYRLKPLEILDDDNFPTEEESNSAIKAINLVLIKLEKTKTTPSKILHLLSHCYGLNINKKFVIQISKHMKINEEDFIDSAIELLISYSLLDRIDDKRYSMHDLTQLTCRSFQRKNSITNLNLLENYFKLELKAVKEHINSGNHYVFHFIYMFRIYRKRMSKVFHKNEAMIKNLLESKGLFLEAIEILESILLFNTETYGESDDITINTKNCIALCFHKMGKYNKALEILYSIDTKNFQSSIATKNNVALILCDMGKYNEALEVLNSFDKELTEIYGVKVPSTLIVKHNIAYYFCKIGKYKEALEINYFIDKIQTEILGIKHSNTMTTKHNIATCLLNIGNYKDALETFYFLDKIRTEVLGEKHPDTMITKNMIAYTLIHMGNYHKALEVLYSVDKSETEILGINNPNTLELKSSIALCLFCMGKYKEALEIFRFADKIRTEILGINNPDTLNFKYSIALCLFYMGKYNEALEIFYLVYNFLVEASGIIHIDKIKTQFYIAICWSNLKIFNKKFN